MSNINQIEINNTVYNIVDAKTKNKSNKLLEYYRKDVSAGLTGWVTNKVKNDHGTISFKNGVGLTTKEGYSLNLWGDTGNFRYDKYDFENETYTTLGYIPLQNVASRKSYQETTDTTLFTPASGYAINYLRLRRWGQIGEFSIRLTHTNSISVPAAGKLSSFLTLGTLASAWRPADIAYVHSYGDNAGPLWGYLHSNGSLVLTAAEATGAARTIAASTSSSPNYLDLNGVYIIAMTNQYE